MVRAIPRAEISEGWETIIQPSRADMLSKNEKTSLAVDGAISASTIGGRRGTAKGLQARLMASTMGTSCSLRV